jgi:hypothetical protein
MTNDYQWFIEAMEKLEAASPEEKATMSDAEVFEISVRIVSNKLISEGAELLQVNSGLNSLPAIWFKRNDRLNYIVITTARYPQKALPPDNTQAIQQHLSDQNANGYWVGVSLAHEFEVFDPEANEGMPLMKGFGVLPAVSDPVNLSSI